MKFLYWIPIFGLYWDWRTTDKYQPLYFGDIDRPMVYIFGSFYHVATSTALITLVIMKLFF